jgi:hypothetical protein
MTPELERGVKRYNLMVRLSLVLWPLTIFLSSPTTPQGARLHDRPAVVHQRRHQAFWIELEVFRIVLLTAKQVDLPRLPSKPFLKKYEPHLLAADGIAEFIGTSIETSSGRS